MRLAQIFEERGFKDESSNRGVHSQSFEDEEILLEREKKLSFERPSRHGNNILEVQGGMRSFSDYGVSPL
jgi:hypothetical protein